MPWMSNAADEFEQIPGVAMMVGYFSTLPPKNQLGKLGRFPTAVASSLIFLLERFSTEP